MRSGQERTELTARNAHAALLSNLIGLALGLVSVPLLLFALGTSAFGTLQVLLSLGNVIIVADAGIGLALRTRVGQLAGARQHDLIPRQVGSALAVVTFIALVLGGLGLALLARLDVSALLNTPQTLAGQTERGLAVVLATFVVRMPLSVLHSAHGGMQLQSRLLFWTVGGNVAASMASIGTALLTRRLDLALAIQASMQLAAGFGSAYAGCRLERCTRPAFSGFDARAGWALARAGFVFYLLQVEIFIIGGLDNLVVARVVGVEGVAIYSVAYRLISLAFSMVYSIGASFWNAVAEAFGASDYDWIHEASGRYRRLGTLTMAVLAAGYVAAAGPAITLWTGGRISVDPLLLIALGTYFALLGHTMIDTAILNGTGRVAGQVMTVGVDAAVNLTVSILAARHLGYVGVGLGTLTAYVLCSFVPLQILARRAMPGGWGFFWTRELTATMACISAGAAIAWATTDVSGPPLAKLLATGVASLVCSIVLVRLLVGVEGVRALAGVASPLRRYYARFVT